MSTLQPTHAGEWVQTACRTPVAQTEVQLWAAGQLASGPRITAAVWGWGMLRWAAKHPHAVHLQELEVQLAWDGRG